MLTGPRRARTFGQTLFWVSLWGYFWMWFTFEPYTEWSRWPSPVWVGLIQSAETYAKQKDWVRGNSFCLELEYQSFPAFKHEPKHQFFLGLKPAGLQTRTCSSTASTASPVCWCRSRTLRPSWLDKPMANTVSLCLSLPTPPSLSLSLFLSLSLPLYLYDYLYLYLCLSIYLSIYLSIIYLSSISC